MSPIIILNRPFSTDFITGFMLPDGIFEATLGRQNINAQFLNSGATTQTNFNIYIESVSHPNINISPNTYYLSSLKGSASRTLGWEADFTNVPAGIHYVSFIVETPAGRNRIIKKIFVTKVQFDASTTSFSAETPEGILKVRFKDLVIPADIMCCKRILKKRTIREKELAAKIINDFAKLFTGHKKDFVFCPPGYLPLNLEASITLTPPYSGQFGELPFQDPWWKILLCIIAIILLIAAAIVAAEEGDTITVTAGDGSDGTDGTKNCCGVGAEGGSSSYVAAGLVAAAAAAATAAAASDVKDPFYRGEENTFPEPGELTISEDILMSFIYPEPVALGQPFAAGLDWKYSRITTGKTYTYSSKDMNKNIHVLSKYIISAPDIIRYYQREPFMIKAEFYDKDNNKFKGDDLFVQCFLIGPNNEYHKIILQDDGIEPDQKHNDGVYTGIFYFEQEKKPQGIWTYYVIAQDINNANPDMKPEEAAQIIGGMVLTHQLVITFEEDQCPFVPDGHVNVI